MAGEAPGIRSSEPLKNMCAIVEEREKTIKEYDVKIEYYKNALENILNQRKNLEKESKKIEEEYTFFQIQNKQLEYIKTSLKSSQEVTMQSLVNHQYFEQLVAKELEAKEKETECLEQECQNMYNEAQEKLKQNPFYQELEKQKVEFLKLDIKRRDLEVKIRQRKRINAQKRDIQKKIFYNFFIKMAENYVIEKRAKELEKLKIEEVEAIKRLYAVQEEVKRRQKFGVPKDKIKRMTNITIGSQENRIENLQNRVVVPQQKEEPRLFNEKLNNMFQQGESKNIVTSPKVLILNQKVIMPTLVTPNFAPTEKRKNKSVDLSRKWQKLMNSSFSKVSNNGQCISQKPDNQLSSSSQQSQLSQPEHVTMETVHQYPEQSLKNTDASQQLMQEQESQRISEIKKNIPIQYQMVENMKIGPERVKMECSPTEATRYDHYSSSDVNKPITPTQEPERSIYMREKVPLSRYQMVENINGRTGHGQLNVEDPHFMLSPPALQEHAISSCETIQGSIGSTPRMSYASSNVSAPKCEISTKIAVSEQSKSVRFNLEQTNCQPEAKSMFGGQSIFGNNFSSFANRASLQNETLLEQETSGANRSAFDISQEASNIGIDFNVGENGPLRNSMDSFELDENLPQTKPPEMTSFGGGCFSIGKAMFKPF